VRSLETVLQEARSPEPLRRPRTNTLTGGTQPDFRAALQRALDHLKDHPQDTDGARIAALCLSRIDYASEAERYYEIARRHSRLSHDDLLVRAMGLARGNLREQAIAAYLEILEREPDDAEALQRLAAIYYSQSRYKEALPIAERLARCPDKGGAVAGYALMGVVLHDEHRSAEAVLAYEQVLKLDPKLESLTLPAPLFFADFAQDLIETGRAEEARGHLTRMLESREDPHLLNVLGLADLADGKEDDAEKSWKRAIEVDPKFHRPWVNLGKLALRTSRPAEAIRYLERAHSLDPNSFEPAYQLSLAYHRVGRAALAERFRKLADTLRKGNPYAGPLMGTDPDETP
jgi:tetratricopeptide (TPR) repeat protein